MIRTKENQPLEERVIRGGNGETVMQKLLTGPEEMNGKGRMFNLMALLPGRSIGEHQHTGDSEYFYFMSGEGEYYDNGVWTTVHAGDIAICADGETHALINKSDKTLVFMALILYA